jgi:uncharacterized cysteine cluster protein YcgN (CxxCxxCC family)
MKRQNKDVNPGSREWDELCARCGRCCYEKLDYRGRIFYTNKPCPHLDTKANQCRIYLQRTEVHPDCARLTPKLASSGFLPADCPYVAGLEGYHAPELKAD